MHDNCYLKTIPFTASFSGNIYYLFLVFAFSAIVLQGCSEEPKHIGQKEVVAEPAAINPTAAEIIQSSLKDAMANNGRVADIQLKYTAHIQHLYQNNDYKPLWSSAGQWAEQSDSLFQLINNSHQLGLFPEDYHSEKLTRLRQQILEDTFNKENNLDASLWAEADLLFTAAFVSMIKDLKVGRIIEDSVLEKDKTIAGEFFEKQLALFQKESTNEFVSKLEPDHIGYAQLKESLRDFLATADLKRYTYVNPKDSANLLKAVYVRLSEEDTSIHALDMPDSLTVAQAIKTYRKNKGLRDDNKLTSGLISYLNNSDREKFIRIAITLDRYKQLPELPKKHIWVNIPGYQLQLKDNDTVIIASKVVVGKPNTRTPQLTSVITDMITYPKWHIPNSIIAKEILPALKKDVGYLAKKGYSLADYQGNEIDPTTVKWSQYEKEIPYRVIQGSGDDNALGVIKFNFPNKFSVYLHDTNQRHLFSKDKRALSHGCVRVESWDTLATYLLLQDSVHEKAVPIDSMQTWLALKEKHVIPLRNRVPLYIRYFTCEGVDGALVFHDDVYGEDRSIREKYFKEK
jgi:murein L,D-transpeptidase YcbB/YkuD